MAGTKRGRVGTRKDIVAEGRGHACLRAEGASWAALVTEARGRVAVDTAGLRLLAVAVARRAARAPLLRGILLDDRHGRADHERKDEGEHLHHLVFGYRTITALV